MEAGIHRQDSNFQLQNTQGAELSFPTNPSHSFLTNPSQAMLFQAAAGVFQWQLPNVMYNV